MKTLVTYQSKTGFTKKYAEWISQDLSCEMKPLSEVKPEDIAAFELVIHGGWIMANRVSGLKKIMSMNPAKLVVFGVGLGEKGKYDSQIVKENKLEKTPFFYMEGGLDPNKMGFFTRLVIKMATKEEPLYKDNTDKKFAMELVTAVKAM